MGEFWRIVRKILRRRSSIRERLLLLLLISSLLSALVFAGLSFYGIAFVQEDIAEMGEQLSKAGDAYTREYINKTSEDTIADLAMSKAEFIDHELSHMEHDVTILADALTWIHKHTSNYLPLSVFDSYNGKVPPAAPCIIYSPEARERGIETVRQEVELAANITGTMELMEKIYSDYFSYSATYFGSKSGFIIYSSVYMGDEYSPISDDPAFSYDPCVRPWYINAVNANSVVFSAPYITILSEEHNDVEVISCSAPYYDSEGIAGVASMDLATKELRQYIQNTDIGDKGINFIMNYDGRVIFSPVREGVLAETDKPQDLRKSEPAELAKAAYYMANGESGVLPVELDGEKYVLAFAPIPTMKWSLGMLVSQDELSSSLQESHDYFMGQMESFSEDLEYESLLLLQVALLAFSIMVVIMIFMSKELSDRFVRPIKQMADGVREITGGNLDKKLDITTGDEIENLANCFNSMTDELKVYIDNLSKATAEKEKAAVELSIASNIQMSALPQDFLSDYREFQIYATMDAAKGVGGDFYDFYLTDENQLVITIADVSGKGIPAALYMMRAKTALKNMVLRSKNTADFAEIMKMANQELCRENDEMMFVTVFMAKLDLTTGELVYVNGGHNAPLVRADGKFFYLKQPRKHMMLGINEAEMYEAHSLVMQRGDMVFLYTDGVTEAMNEAEEEYSEERLQETLNSRPQKDVREMLAAVRQDVRAYAGDAEQSDDITMLGLKFCGCPDDV